VGQTRPVELGAQDAKPFPSHISASTHRSLLGMPYKFFSRSHLKLFDEEDLELEPSALARGQWIHSAVEKIMKEKEDLSFGMTKFLKVSLMVLIKVKIKNNFQVIFGQIFVQGFLRQLRRFVDFEMEWQKNILK